MTSQQNFAAILSHIATGLAGCGFARKAHWFTRRNQGETRFECLHIRKIPQSASKRIVFQVVAFAGRTPPGTAPLISSLTQALTNASFEHHLVDGNAERLWTVWPSTNAVELGDAVTTEIARQSLPALERYWHSMPETAEASGKV